jgi:hypothetical protein
VVFAVIEVIDKRKQKEANLNRKGRSVEAPSEVSTKSDGKSSTETASLVGTSRTKVEKARTVIDQAPEESYKWGVL